MSQAEKAPEKKAASPTIDALDDGVDFAHLQSEHQKAAESFLKEQANLRALAENKGNFKLESLNKLTGLPFTKAAYRNYQSFTALTRETVNDLIKNSEEKDGTFTLLYPGGGSHFAPLETVFTVLDTQNTKRAKLIYTDIDSEAYAHMEQNLNALITQGILIKSDQRPATVKLEKGEEKQLTYLYQSKFGPKEITFTYAIDASDTSKGDHSYYKQKYFDEADLVISHDSSSDIVCDFYFLESFLLSSAQGESKNKVFYFEEWNSNTLMPELMPGKVIRSTMPYGCADDMPGNEESNDHLGKANEQAAAYVPDMAFYKNLDRNEIKAYLNFALSVNSVRPYDRTTTNGNRTMTYGEKDFETIIPTLLNIAEKVKDRYPKIYQRIVEFITPFVKNSGSWGTDSTSEAVKIWLNNIPREKQQEVMTTFVSSTHPINELSLNRLLEGSDWMPYYKAPMNDHITFTLRLLEATNNDELLHEYADKSFSLLESPENRDTIVTTFNQAKKLLEESVPRARENDKILLEKYGFEVKRGDDYQNYGCSWVREITYDNLVKDPLYAEGDKLDSNISSSIGSMERIKKYLQIAKQYGSKKVKVLARELHEKIAP